MKAVSLDSYRTPGVRVFTGFDRGEVVAESIRDNYGYQVTIEVPADVFYVSDSFLRGIVSVLPDATFHYLQPTVD